MKHSYTNQRQIRAAFWDMARISYGLNRIPEQAFKRRTGEYRTDTRCAFVDYVNALACNKEISEALAFRATLA